MEELRTQLAPRFSASIVRLASRMWLVIWRRRLATSIQFVTLPMIQVGDCMVTERIASHIKENDLGTTFGGGMIAMAAVIATLEAIEIDRLLENVREVESYLRARLTEVEQVVQVHGRGFLLGLEF